MAKEKKEEYASKKDIENLQEGFVQISKAINELSKEVKNPKVEIAGTADMSKIKESTIPPVDEAKVIEEGGTDKSPIPPAWRKMVDDILGIEFGIDIVYPQAGSGFLFKIIVPAEKSNADQAYKELYKTDIRTKAVSYSDGIEGVRKFCELVKTNLSRSSN